MNRPLLLVICDFLLLSLLALADFDVREDPAEATPEAGAALEQDAGLDVMFLLEQALEEELAAREGLESSLDEARESLELTSAELAAKEEALAEREREMREREEALTRQREQAEQQERLLSETRATAEELRERSARLERERQEMEQERRRLEEERTDLSRELAEVRTDTTVSRERIRQLEARLTERERTLSQRQEELERARERERELERRSRDLETTLEVARVERSSLEDRLVSVQTEVERERQERQQALATTERLTEGVSRLAETSVEISEEVRGLRPMTTNEIFEQYRENRVETIFEARERLILGERERRVTAPTILVADGDRAYALLHVNDTPFAPRWSDGTLERVDGFIVIGSRAFRLREIRFLEADPRILAIPLPRHLADEQDIKVFSLAKEPFRFDRAVVINNQDNNFGESSFKSRTDNEAYVEMDRRILSRITGEFTPSTGDLVITRSGNVLGMVVDSRHAPILENLTTTEGIRLGDDYTENEVRALLRRKRDQAPRL